VGNEQSFPLKRILFLGYFVAETRIDLFMVQPIPLEP